MQHPPPYQPLQHHPGPLPPQRSGIGCGTVVAVWLGLGVIIAAGGIGFMCHCVRADNVKWCRNAVAEIERVKSEKRTEAEWIERAPALRGQASYGAYKCRQADLVAEADALAAEAEMFAKVAAKASPGVAGTGANVNPTACPKGKVIVVAATGEKIVCTGSGALIESGWNEAKSALLGAGWDVSVGADGDNLRAERGNEQLIIRYAKAGDPNVPKCVAIHARHGTKIADWRSLARMYMGVLDTSLPEVAPFKKPGAPVTVGASVLRVQLEGDAATGVLGLYLDRSGCE